MKTSFYVLALSLLLFASCSENQNTDSAQNDGDSIQGVENTVTNNLKTEVYFFHKSVMDETTTAVGKYALKALELNFKNEMKSGQVVFNDINLDDVATKSLIEKFEVKDSGIYILTIDNGKEFIENLTDFAFLTAVDETEVFMEGIKTNIEEKIKKVIS